MADSRIRSLTDTMVSGDIAALLNTLYLVVDDASFTNAKKTLLKTLLTEAVVTANTNNYQALTPKAFYDSVMSTTVKGIGQLALDADVTAKTGTGLLNSVHQVLMQAQWKKDFFVKNGTCPDGYKSNTDSLSTAKALSFTFLYNGIVSYNGLQVGPTLPEGVYYGMVNFRCILAVGTSYWQNNNYLSAGGAGVETSIPLGGGVYLDLYNGGQNLLIFTPGSSVTVRTSIDFNAVLKP
jgi:hypothetical protein